MGRRSINTTKSGKYMNPTDQARKEARKKELKKNKKQRQMVRAAVLKGKDPHQILMELEKIDQMEYNVMQPSPLNEKVLKDKRKKLKDTLDRVLRMYNKDDPDKWVELKRMQVEYERKKTALFNYFEAVKNAQTCSVDEIPLPLTSLSAELQAVLVNMPSQIPLPAHAPPGMRPPGLLPAFMQPHHSILKKTSAYVSKDLDRKKEPPGVPVGPPPELSDDEEPMEEVMPIQPEIPPPLRHKTIRFADEMEVAPVDHTDARINLPDVPPGTENMNEEQEDDDTEDEEDDEMGGNDREGKDADDKPRPTSLQQRMLAMAGQDIDQFMREMEEVHKKRKADRAADLENRLQALEKSGKKEVPRREESPPPPGTTVTPMPAPHVPGTDAPAPVLPAMPRSAVGMPMPGMPPMMFRPPPPALMGIRLPPGPPPGLPPRLGIRLPPGPPPGMPPRMMRPNIPLPPGTGPMLPPHPAATNVLSAAPQLISRPSSDKTTGATIQANAQIRNLSADVTRFLPTALRVKRDPKLQKKETRPTASMDMKPEIMQPAAKTQTKDDAYMQFMREMEGLL